MLSNSNTLSGLEACLTRLSPKFSQLHTRNSSAEEAQALRQLEFEDICQI